jgi:P2-related tail formation protein
MSDVNSILPSNSEVFEKALAAGMSDELQVPFAELLNPYTTRADMLVWLGASVGLDLWFDDWPLSRRREAVAQAMGVSVLLEGEIAAFKTTRTGAVRYLALVDGSIVDAVAYPAPAFADDAFCDAAIIDHPPFLATYLVGIDVFDEDGDYADQSFESESFAGDVITEPYDRCLKALRVAKANHTEVLVDFTTYRVITAGDGLLAGDGYNAGQYIARTKL